MNKSVECPVKYIYKKIQEKLQKDLNTKFMENGNVIFLCDEELVAIIHSKNCGLPWFGSVNFMQILQGYFTGTCVIIWLPQW